MTPEEEQARKVVGEFLKSGGNFRQLLSPSRAEEIGRNVLANQLYEQPSVFGRGWTLYRARECFVVRARNGDRQAHAVLEKVALEFIESGEMPPEPILSYHIDVSKGRGPKLDKAQDPSIRSWRNWIIVEAVRRASEIIANDTRACAIVHDMLYEMGIEAPTTGTIQKIWTTQKRRWRMATD